MLGVLSYQLHLIADTLERDQRGAPHLAAIQAPFTDALRDVVAKEKIACRIGLAESPSDFFVFLVQREKTSYFFAVFDDIAVGTRRDGSGRCGTCACRRAGGYRRRWGGVCACAHEANSAATASVRSGETLRAARDEVLEVNIDSS